MRRLASSDRRHARTARTAGIEEDAVAARSRLEHDPFAVVPGGWSREVTLRDGGPVLLRQIRPEDRTRLAEGIRRLSPASRYLRFSGAVGDEPSEAHLRYLTEVDHVDHEAIVALDRTRPDDPGVGVARYVREPFEPTVAEAAVTVADAHHGRGAGTALLGALAARAHRNGIAVFRSYVLAGNRPMLEVLDHLGAHRHLESEGLWRVDLELPDDLADLPRTAAGRAFAEAARGRSHLVSLSPPVWARRRRRPAVDRHLGADTAAAGTLDADDTDELTALRSELEGWLGRSDDR